MRPSTKTIRLMQSIREKDAGSGQTVTWCYLPMVIDSLEMNTEYGSYKT